MNRGILRLTFGMLELADRVERGALAPGVFGVAHFLLRVNRVHAIQSSVMMNLGLRGVMPSKADLKFAFWPVVRGTLVGVLFGAMPGTGDRP